jgi:hypothetical protein
MLTVSLDNSESSHGLPCSIQLVARSQFDEELMMVSQIVAGILQ